MRHFGIGVMAIALVLALCATQAAAFVYEEWENGGDGAIMDVPGRGWPGGDLFPNHDPAYNIVSLTNNDYSEYTSGDTPVFPHGYYLKYPCFNADGTRLACVARTKFDGVGDPYEIWVCDYDASTHMISNPVQVTSTGGTGDVDSNIMCSWSRTDPDLLMFLEAHITQANPIKTYDCGTLAFATLYDPALDTNGYDSTNPGFYALDDGAIVVGTGYNTGNDRIILFDGTYPSTTISSADKNLDPACNYDGTRVSYYSTNSAYPYPAGSIFTTYSGGVWTEDTNGWGDPSTDDVPGLWAFYSGKSDDRILSLRTDLGWTATALALYDSDGTLLSDLTGDGGTDFQWVYANHGWDGPGGEILFRAEELTHSGYGNNMFLALAPPTAVWVDDGWDGPANCGGHSWGYDAYATIQEAVAAVAAGGVVNVAAGPYTGQVHITTSDISLVGAGVDSTVIISPVTLTDYFMTGTNYNYPVVFIDGATGVALSNMTVDGDHKADTNERFVGVGFWNGDGSMTDMEVLNVMSTVFSGAQHGVGVYSYNDIGGSYTIAMTDVLVDDYQKTGIALFGDGMTVDLTRVTTVGQGATDVTAQNGIQVGYGAGGTLEDCVITGNVWIGPTWTASALLPSDGTSLTVDGLTLDDNQTGIYLIDMDGSFNDVTLTNPSGDALYAYSTGAKRSPMPRREASPFDSELAGDGSRYAMTASFTNSTFTGADATDSYGPTAWVGGSCDFTVSGCDVSHWDLGIVAYEDGGTVTSHINDNLIYLNGSYGVYTNAAVSRATQDATDNWWGHETGPYHDPLNPSGLGNPVSDAVDFDPYLTSNIVCTPDPEYLTATALTETVAVYYQGGGGGLMYGYSLTFTWDGAIASTAHGKVTEGSLLSDQGNTFFYPRTTGTNEITVDCAILGAIDGVTGPGTMFSIEFTGLSVGTSDIDITVGRIRDRDNNTLTGFAADDGLLIVDVDVPIVTAVHITNDEPDVSDTYVKNGDHVTVTATVTDDDPLFGEANIKANLLGLGGAADASPDLGSYTGTTATWTLASVTCTPADDEHEVTVTVTATDPIGNTADANDTIIADNVAPSAVTGFDASPGNQECDLSWTNGTDTYYEGTVVQRADVPGEYPQYLWFVMTWPGVDGAYPGSELLGTNVYNSTGTSHTDGVVPRNIYYYQAFSYDGARNYGPAATTARDLATNYWLGDISDAWGSWGYNGEVDDFDILKLSDVYGTPDPVGVGEPNGDAECDVGPTVHPDWHRLGLPLPDDKVEFEDLMVFAMNYGVVAARIVPFLPEEFAGAPLAVTLGESAGEDVCVALRLEGNASEVKGVSASVSYDASELEFVSARLTDDMLSPIGEVFFWYGEEDGRVLVDVAVLGTGVTVGGSGDLAVLTFRSLAGDYSVEVESARLRDVNNLDLDARLGDYASDGDAPIAFRLVRNAPNPFNPKTTVAYHVPRESEVTIRIYDVAGRCVRTLVDGVVEPGRHAAVWDGTNDGGDAVGSGIYFCTMEAPDFHESSKMTLLK